MFGGDGEQVRIRHEVCVVDGREMSLELGNLMLGLLQLWAVGRVLLRELCQKLGSVAFKCLVLSLLHTPLNGLHLERAFIQDKRL